MVPKHYSGRTKFRIGLVIVGMLSFFSLAIFVSHRESTEALPTAIAFVDNQFYFVHNLLMTAFAFSMVPLADFQVRLISFLIFKIITIVFFFNQVFEYNSPFWNVLKSLSTYGLLADLESMLQFFYQNMGIFWSEEYLNKTKDSLPLIFNLIILAVFRCLLLAFLVLLGTKFLALICKTRKLPSSYYVPIEWNIIEYIIWHALGYFITVIFEQLEPFQVCSVVAIFMTAYTYARESFFWSKKRLCKANVY
mgnify:CR=1 FL=1